MDTRAAIDALGSRPYLLGVLASLKGCSDRVTDAIVQLIACDERPILEDLGIVRRGAVLDADRYVIELTDFGREVIAACPDLDENGYLRVGGE